jgi:putative MFS transporter
MACPPNGYTGMGALLMETADRPLGTDTAAPTAAGVLSRLDRINVWSLSYLFIGIIGVGFLFTFFDIVDINVSWIQTCVQLRPGCTPANAGGSFTSVLVLNLAGYGVGTLLLSPMSDRIGRRNMLIITLAITGLSSLYDAFAPDLTSFIVARTITGIGIGADLAIVNAYITEVAPRHGRAKYTASIFVFSGIGGFLGAWLGVLFTTPAEPWPNGLPFALGGEHFQGDGWRWMYGLGALLAVIGLVLRHELPESPRWLITRGRIDEADRVVTKMEERALRKGPLPDPVPDPDYRAVPPDKVPYRTLFSSSRYVRRIVLLLSTWIFGYATVYGFTSGFTVVIAGLTDNGRPVYSPSTAGLIAATGSFGVIIGALVAVRVTERLDRRWWLPIGTVCTAIGCLVTALAGTSLYLAFLGSIIIFFGFDIWVAPMYALSTESFPTRARGTGFALVDGIGHLGGALAVLVVVPNLSDLSPLGAFLLIAGFQAVAAILVQFAPNTRNQLLDEVSP